MGALFSRQPEMLPEGEERALAGRWREARDQAALSRLISSHLGLVGNIAKGYRARGLSYEDLFQEGCLGLTVAAHRYDPARRPRFATYAAYWIRASVLNLILRSHGPVRVGTTHAQRKIFFGLSRARRRLEQEGGSPRDCERLAAILEVDARELEGMAVRLAQLDVSSDAPRPGDGRPWLSTFEDGRPGPEAQVIEREEREQRAAQLALGLRALDPRERAIIRARHLRNNPAGLKELGQKFGISRERIRQLELRAKDKLGRLVAGARASG
jgi:RNA polymerase sigma-32 factor